MLDHTRESGRHNAFYDFSFPLFSAEYMDPVESSKL